MRSIKFKTLLRYLLPTIIWVILGWFGWQVLTWGIFDATFIGNDRHACQSEGACWVFISHYLWRFLWGFYPDGEIWRIVTIVALAVAIFFGLGRKSPSLRRLSLFTLFALFPLVSFFLLRGGFWGIPQVDSSRWGGLMLTLYLSWFGISLSLPLGTVLALARRSELPIFRALSVTFIEVWRGVPLISVLFMASVMLPLFAPEHWQLDKFLRAMLGITLFASAYMAEVIRGGLQAIGKGQQEAAQALGLSYWQSMRHIVLPQAFRIVIPGIANTFIGLFKDTTLVLIIGMFDLLGMVQAATTDPDWLGFTFEGYLFAGFVYWAFCYGISLYSKRWEVSHDHS